MREVKLERRIIMVLGAILFIAVFSKYFIQWWPESGYVLAAMSGYIVLFVIIIAQRLKNSTLKEELKVEKERK